MPFAIGTDADQVPPATQRVKDLPSAEQFQAPASQVPVEGAVDEPVPVPTGAAAEVAGVAGAADEAAGACGAAELDAAADSVAKTPGADCVY